MVENGVVEEFYRNGLEIKRIIENNSFIDLGKVKPIQEIIDVLNTPLQVMVMGAFSTGKSSFVNALLGENVTSVAALPTTAIITKLVYGINEETKVHFLDNTIKSYSNDDFNKLTTENDSSWDTLRKNISYVEKIMPLDVLKNINIIDSPGLEAQEIHTKITRKFVNSADVVFWMFRADNVGTTAEIECIESLDGRLLPIAIVNMMDTLDDEEDDPEEFLNDIRHKLAGKVRSVVGISAKLATEGHASNDDDLLRDSNIHAVEQLIDETIVPQRNSFKLDSFMDKMAVWLDSLYDQISGYIVYKKNTASDSEYTTEKSKAEKIAQDVYYKLGSLLKYAQQEAAQEKPSACLLMAVVALFSPNYTNENKIDRIDKALKYLECAAKKNNMLAQLMLSTIYLELNQDDQAIHWANILNERYMEEADLPEMQGDVQFILAKLAENRGEIQKSINLYKQAVKNDSFGAANNLGFAYQHGKGVDIDNKKALQYYQIAIGGDIPVAQYNLGFMYYNGLGTAEDKREALKWIKMAAENDHSTAQYSLGTFYINGECGLTTNVEEGIRWLKLAADQHDADALMMLFLLYAGFTNDTAVDYVKGISLGEELYEKFMDINEYKEGTTQIALLLAEMYDLGGHGIEANPQKAIYWYEIAAKEGNAEAQYCIGVAYVADEGIPVDFEKAHYWLEKSAEQGDEGAIEALAKLNAVMNSKKSNQVANNEGCLVWLAVPFCLLEAIYYLLA